MKRNVVFLIGGIIVLVVTSLIAVSIVDEVFYPTASLRLIWWQKLGLPVNKTISSLFLPKADSKEDLDKFRPQTMYWIYKDQISLSPDKGFICGAEGKISKMNYQGYWQIITDKNQTITLSLVPSSNIFFLRRAYYDSKLNEWSEQNIKTVWNLFDQGDSVRVKWDCPVSDPNTMIANNDMIKEEFLRVSPISISKELTNENI